MIVHVTEQFHDYEPKSFYVDTDKLDPTNPVDKALLSKCKGKSENFSITIDASNWEENPKFAMFGAGDIDIGLSGCATVRKKKGVPIKVDKSCRLTIDFDC